jgi:LysM repeat protein
MSELKKAELVEIGSGNNPQPVGTPDVVQFNPTSLRVQISNRTAGGQQAGAQARQRPGVAEVTVSFDLVFDTADEGGDVLRKTSIVDRYVRPRGNQAGQEAPPRVQFTWGSFQIQGTMDSTNTDIDLFDADGTPLRAKVAVSIKGQDPRWAYQPAPQRTPSPATAGGQAVNADALPAGAPGSSGSSKAVDKVVQAMPGEGLAQVAARAGLDPGAWRALAGSVDNPLALALGQEVALPGELAPGAASGANAQGSDPAGTTAGLGLVGAAGNAARRAPQQGGLALTAQGGIGGAIGQAHASAHQASAGASLAAFGLAAAGTGTGDSSDRPWGAGVPLRPKFGAGVPAARRDPTLPAWLAAPAPAGGSAATPNQTAAPRPRGPKPGCGCKNG